VAPSSPTRPATTASAAPEPDESWRNTPPEPGAAAQLVYPAAELSTLPNGLTVAVVRRPTRVATLAVVVRHGQSAVETSKSGLAALTARMLTEGTRHRSALALAEAVEGLGSSLEHDSGRDDSTLSLHTLVQDVPEGLTLLAEVVQEPAFAAADFSRVQREWIDGLVAERQSPMRLGSLVGLRLLLGPDHGAPVGGSVVDVEKLRVADLAKFHRERYVPASAAVIVVGDVSVEGAREAVARAFGKWKTQKPVPPPRYAPIPTAAPTRVVVVDRPDSVQSAIFVGQTLPARKEPGHEARLLLSSVVGGLFTSRINDNLREQHAYTYGARSDVAATRLWGAFVVQTSVETAVTADALGELVSELRRAKDPSLGAPITGEEVARARADLASALGAHLEQTDRMAADVATLFVHGLGPRYHAEFESTLAAVTTAQVAEQAQRLDPERLVVVVVGAKSSIQPALEKKGFVVTQAGDALTL